MISAAVECAPLPVLSGLARRPLRLAVASGKGGTGKTTVAANLAYIWGGAVQLLDCDVEEPNVHLFFDATPEIEETVYLPVPRVDTELCDCCGECSRFCAYHAIVSIRGSALVFPEMCHACGGCAKVCPRGAISEVPHRIGTVEQRATGDLEIIQGRLDVGAAMAPPVIRAVKVRASADSPQILDAPPGTSCPFVSVIRDVDYVLLVTEPTPFGLHDLQLAVNVVREVGVPFGVIINRAGIGDARVHEYCVHKNIDVLAELPDDRGLAEAYSRSVLAASISPAWRGRFERLLERVRQSAEAPCPRK